MKNRVTVTIVAIIAVAITLIVFTSLLNEKDSSNNNESQTNMDFTVYVERPEDVYCIQVMTDVSLVEGYYYTVNDGCSAPYVEFENGTKISLRNALEEGSVTIAYLLDKGIPIFKK